MMSKKQLACMLTLHLIYLLLGASIFYHIESPLEMAQRAEDALERLEIKNLLYENYLPEDTDKQDQFLKKLSDYCGKSMFNYTSEDDENNVPIRWDFYHSFFFSYTVVSTIGYGNLAPTTSLSRILMIFYALFGIPINGILLANLGEYFGLQLISIYRKYKHGHRKKADKAAHFIHSFGMFGQIVLYLVPGFLFFIFLPACLFVVFEGWDYVAAVYYAFVTLTTIGFGDLVAGTSNHGFGIYFDFYEIFLIVWITFGLGYIVMLLGFITSVMRSERVHKLEHKLVSQIKKSQNKILSGFTRDVGYLRRIINEANLMKFKPVYSVDFIPKHYRSTSCPELTFDAEPRDPIVRRKRANSENIHLSARDMMRIQSDTNLLGIDKEKTFTAAAIVRPAELLARVVNALGGMEQQENDGLHMFTDSEILASERGWKIGNENIPTDSPTALRNRALSVAVPNYRKDSDYKSPLEMKWSQGSGEYPNARPHGKLSLPTDAHYYINELKIDPIQPNTPARKISFKDDNPDEYIQQTRKGRKSLFPSFNLGEENKYENEGRAYMERTKKGRKSIFPSFDFSDPDKDAEAYREKTKKGRRSIFPTFDFSEESDDEAQAKEYREKTKKGRKSIFPTFDFLDEDDSDDAEKYRAKTKKGRKSIFPAFDFSEKSDDEQPPESDLAASIRHFQEKHKKSRRGSIFPSFGKKRDDEGDEEQDDSSDVKKYQEKTKKGRGSIWQQAFGFGKDRKQSADESISEAAEDDSNNKGLKSVFDGDVQTYQKSTESGRKSLADTDVEDYKNRTRKGRLSLFTPNVNIEELPETDQAEMLENTSVADLIRALAVIQSSPGAERRLGTTRPPGILDLLAPEISNIVNEPATYSGRRRGSIRPDFASLPESNISGGRRGSIRPDFGGLPNLGVRKSSFQTDFAPIAESGGGRRGSIRPDFGMPTDNAGRIWRPDFTSQTRSSADSPADRRRKTSGRPGFTPSLATVTSGAELSPTESSEQRDASHPSPPPSYSEASEEIQKSRRFSPVSGGPSRRGTAPVPRMFAKIRKESIEEEDSDSSRRSSLTDVVVEENKNNT